MDSYFVVGCSADGLTFDGPLTRQQLEKRLGEDYYGPNKTFVAKTPKRDGFALQMGEDELFIIQGKAVLPKPKEIVKSWDLGE
jgi:hypothetical protein